MRKLIFRMAGAFLFAVLACGAGFSQADESTGTIRGTVFDPTGALIAGAVVTATNPATGVVRSTTTGADGKYLIPQLNPATYQLQASAPGFQRERANEVTLTVGQIITLDGHLLVGSAADVVEVNGDITPLIDVEQTQQANTLDQNAIQYLPNASRSLLTEVFTLPGVGSTAGAQAQNQGFYFGSTQVSVGASNGRGNLVTVNSGEDDYGTGAVRFFVPLDAIQEAQVNRNGYQAEFGFASGAAINYITKSGSNRFHGDAFGLFDDRYTNTQTYLSQLSNGSQNPFSQDFFAGGSVGGPILRDRLFAFGSYEFQKSDNAAAYNVLNQPTLQPFNNSINDRSCLTATSANPNTAPSQGCFFYFLANDPRAAAVDPADVALAKAYLNNPNSAYSNPSAPNPFFPLNDPALQKLAGGDNGTFNVPFRNNKAILRLDYQPSQRNTITTTFSLAHGSNVIGGNAADGASNPTRDYEALIDYVHIFNPHLFNKVLFQFAYNSYKEDTLNSNGPEINIQGLNGPFGTLGHNFASTYDAIEYRYEFNDTLDLVKGNHNAKFGASYRPANYNINNPNYSQGEFDFYPGFGITGAPLERGYPGLASFPYAGTTLFNAGLAASAGGFCPIGNPGYCAPPPSTNFSAAETFELQVPYSFEGSSGNGQWTGTAHYAGVFAQDAWKIKPNLTLTYGGRVDFDAEPTPLHTYKFFSPRVGLAYAPFHDQRTVVRIGGGVFVAPTNFLEPFYTNLYGSVAGGSKYLTLTQANISQPNGTYGQYANVIGLYQSSGPLKSPTTAQQIANNLKPGFSGRLAQEIDPSFTSQKVYQASASVAQQIGRDYSVELSYLFYRGNHLPSPTILGYTASPTVQDQVLGPNYTQTAANLAALPNGEAVDYASNGNSIYHAGTVSITKRYSQRIQASANYTWSRSIDDVTDFNYAFASYRPNGTSVQQEKGVSDFNRTNVFVATAVYNTTGAHFRNSLMTQLLGNITAGPVFSASTGSPFDVLLSLPFTNNTPNGNLQARPYHAQRNSGQGPGFDSFDLKFTKGFALKGDNSKRIFLSADTTNLFNAADFSSVYNFFPATADNSFTDNNNVFHPATTTGPYGPNNQYINFATGPFNLHGARPTSTASTIPLTYNTQSPGRRVQLGARFEF